MLYKSLDLRQFADKTQIPPDSIVAPRLLRVLIDVKIL